MGIVKLIGQVVNFNLDDYGCVGPADAGHYDIPVHHDSLNAIFNIGIESISSLFHSVEYPK